MPGAKTFTPSLVKYAMLLNSRLHRSMVRNPPEAGSIKSPVAYRSAPPMCASALHVEALNQFPQLDDVGALKTIQRKSSLELVRHNPRDGRIHRGLEKRQLGAFVVGTVERLRRS